MSPDQRMDRALSDFEAMVISGTSVNEALAFCACEYNFSEAAVERRAKTAFGDLGSIRDRKLREAETLTREHKLDTAIARYLIEKPGPNFPAWFEIEFGRPPTKAERAEFRERHVQWLASNFPFET